MKRQAKGSFNIDIRSPQRKYKVDQDLIRANSKAILSLCGLRDTDLSILIVNNRRIKELNKRYRGINRPTDVLAFPMNERGSGVQPRLLGDIVISMEKTYSQARERGHSPECEFLILLTHGILHLIGYDHEISPLEERRMKKRENLMLTRLTQENTEGLIEKSK